MRRLCKARCCASQLGLLEGVQRAAIEHDLTYVPGFGALLDLVVRDDPTHVATGNRCLSVLLGATDATDATVIHGPTRAELDPAHTQLIIDVTDPG